MKKPSAPNNTPPVGEYRIEKKWRIFLCLVGMGMLIGGGWMLLQVWNEPHVLSAKFCFNIVIGFSLALWGLYSLADSQCERLIIDRECMVYTGVFHTKTLYLNDVYGIKQDRRGVLFESKSNPELIIVYSIYYEDYYQVEEWAYKVFRNLDKTVAFRERNKLADDSYYGATRTERADKARRWKRIIRPLNWISGIIIFSLIFFYQYIWSISIGILTALPIVGAVIYHKSKGMVRVFMEKRTSPYPNISGLTIFPALILAIFAASNENVVDYTHFWMPALFVFALLMIVFLWHDVRLMRHQRSTFWGLLFGVVFVATIYSYGVVLLYNDILDHSSPIIYRAKVVEKWTGHSRRGTSHHIRLSPWGPETEEESTQVSHSLYDEVSEGDSVFVSLYPGKFDIPYYMVSLH